MKKNKLSIISSFLLFSLITTSCEKFLEKNPQGALTQETFPVSESDLLLATNSVYAPLRFSSYHSGIFPLTDIMSDDARKGSNPGDQESNIGPYDNFTFINTGNELSSWWATLYEGIKMTNVVLVNADNIPMDATLRNRYKGEASFMRALYYFDLVRAWGDVPLVTDLNPPLLLARTPKDQVYNLIINDLLFAIENLPEKTAYTDALLGRASKGAARGILAKVYLFEEDFVNAEKYALEVINSGNYGLEPVFTDANSVNGEHGIESVFEIGAAGLENVTGNQYANVQGVRGTPNRGWGFNRPTPNLRNSFEEGDPRLKGTIIDLGDVIDGIEILGDGTTPDVTTDAQGNIIETESYNRKVWTPGDNVASQFGHNRRILRYSDVLLMAAEALNENNKPSEALIYLNQVRERAREGDETILPDIETTEQNELRNIIRKERRNELALEGHRFWDLVRWGIAGDVLGPLGFQTGKHELFPVPQNEMDLSQGTMQQNPNW